MARVLAWKTRKPHRPRNDVRYPSQGLICPLGSIVDISASGMRIRGEGQPPLEQGRRDTFTINAGGRKLTINACVMWVRRSGIRTRRFEMGIRFEDQRPAMRRLLQYVGEYGHIPGKGECGSAEGSRPSGQLSAEVEIEDLYAVLGIPEDADAAQIRARYRELAHSLHPDRCTDPDAPARFAHISKCYRVLRDPATRERYDELRGRSSRAA
ncbi:MAG: DnaJ domain-containing protein [Phycisphaeraceae bacterium]|nr:DnaJ domain-containing protein [Phycisphaeraceae bacterium]MCW5755473.1 DnaJ domain-containing protein [Phycisphaeraceae bacterium]